MPANLNASSPTGIFPKMLYLSMSSSAIYPMRVMTYHDGTYERALITDTVNAPVPMLSWTCSARLNASALGTFKTFYYSHLGTAIPFYWYNPLEADPDHMIGSNYDATGTSTEGRRTVRFSNAEWNEASDTARTNVSFAFHEVA